MAEGLEIVKHLSENGIFGIMLGLIILAGSSIFLLYQFVVKHSNHLNELIVKLIENVEKNTEVTEEVRDLILNLNHKK
jgi:hypothetical protein